MFRIFFSTLLNPGGLFSISLKYLLDQVWRKILKRILFPSCYKICNIIPNLTCFHFDIFNNFFFDSHRTPNLRLWCQQRLPTSSASSPGTSTASATATWRLATNTSPRWSRPTSIRSSSCKKSFKKRWDTSMRPWKTTGKKFVAF